MKKYILILFILLIISYTTGVFVEFTVPGNMSVSPQIPSIGASFLRSVKQDFSILLLSIFFALTRWLYPCAILLFLCKSFALGFSSAFLLSDIHSGQDMLFSALFPRAILKLPVYVLILYITLEITRYIKSSRSRNPMNKQAVYFIALRTVAALSALLLSSLSEVVLMQLML